MVYFIFGVFIGCLLTVGVGIPLFFVFMFLSYK